MIVPMIKYTMLLHPKDKDAFMAKLMDFGLVQIHGYEIGEDAETQELSATIREIEEAIRRFKKRTINAPGNRSVSHEEFPALSVIAKMERELEQAHQRAETLALEIKLLEPWGDFDQEAVKKIEQLTGREVKFFEYPTRRFNQSWQQEYALQMVNTRAGINYFLIFRRPGEELPLAPITLPSTSLSILKREQNELINKIETLNNRLDGYAAKLSNGLHDKLIQAKDQLALHLAQQQIKSAANNTISIVEAWCPKPEEKKLNQFLDNEKVVYLTEEPSQNELPPVLLKNNWFTRLFEPIGALFALPRYTEMDLTVFFAPFFLLFFGLCLGDVGYGVVIVAATTLLKFKNRKSPYRSYLTLAQLLGLSTIFAGMLSGTLFGLEMGSLEWFAGLRSMFLDYDKLFNLALVIGFLQILFGLGVQAYKLWVVQGYKFALSKIGWIILLISLVDLYVIYSFTTISSILLWISLGCVVVFGAPEKGWLKSIGFGVTDLYNITSVFGDLLSYIRLFALGVSSAILGIVVNSIALSAKGIPYLGFFLFILVLIVGHTANLLLSSLSAFVHPMRLTFVEFYKNSGFIGGGKPFQPLIRKANTNSLTH